MGVSRARVFVAVGIGVIVGAVVGAQVLTARQENVPGFPTIAKMWVTNRGVTEAVPVTVHASSDVIPVTIVGPAPASSLAQNVIVPTRNARQAWEYRQVATPAGQDPSTLLNAAGAEGWEAVHAVTAAGGSVWTLKRPR